MADETTKQDERVARLVGRGIAEAMRSEDFDVLRAWVAGEARAVLTDFTGSAVAGDSEAALRRITWAFATTIWNVTPLPSNGYRPQPRPAPGRNDPCPCGSGDKFKRCCGGGRSPVPLISEEEAQVVLAAHAAPDELERLIADRELPPEMLAILAEELNGRDPATAARVLEPWFEDLSALDARHEPLLELWFEMQAIEHGASEFLDYVLDLEEDLPRVLQPAAWRAAVMPAVVMREIELAKQMISKLRAATPSEPALAQLEVITLLAAGETRQAAERARFWLTWLRRNGLAEAMADVVAMLEKTVRDPEDAARDFRAAEQPLLAELQRCWRGPPNGRRRRIRSRCTRARPCSENRPPTSQRPNRPGRTSTRTTRTSRIRTSRRTQKPRRTKKAKRPPATGLLQGRLRRLRGLRQGL